MTRRQASSLATTRRRHASVAGLLAMFSLFGLLALLAGGPAASGVTPTATPTAGSPAAPAATADPDADVGGVGRYAPVMVVMDTSGSMEDPAGADGGITKIQAARAAVVNVAGALSHDQTFGLLSYPGTASEQDAQGCDKGSVNIPLGTPDPEQTSSVVSGLQAGGGTPTSPALLNATAKLKATGARHAVIVLVSDGMANCGPPVCDTAKKIRAQGVELTVNTVGFDVDTDEGARADLQCVADATGGSYADAGDAEALRAALQKAAASYLTVTAQVPDQLRTAEGLGVDLGTQIPVTVTNTGQQPAPDVRISLDFLNSANTGGALLVPRPIRFLGNLESGASREIWMEVRPPTSAAGKTFSWVVTATTSDGAGSADTGKTTVVESATALGPVLADVKGTVAVLGDSYSSGQGAGAGNYLPGTYAANYPRSVHCNTTMPDITHIPRECQSGPAYSLCHQSKKTYGAVLFGDRAHIIACSGAVTGNMDVDGQVSGQVKMDLQMDQLKDLEKSGPVGAVLMTLGGNDIGFAHLATACATGTGCASVIAHAPIGQEHIDLVNAMGVSLWRVYSKIDQEVNGPDQVKARGGKVAPIVVLPYVRILPRTETTGCLVGVSKTEAGVLNSIIGSLNTTVGIVVGEKARQGRPFYLASDVEDAFLPAHTICAAKGQQWANTVSFHGGGEGVPDGDRDQLAHPNAAGYAAVAQALAGWSAGAKVIKAGPVYGDSLLPAWLAKLFSAPRIGDFFVPATGNVAVSGAGFAPNTPVTALIASTKQTIGQLRADAQGRVSGTVALPTALAPGHHSVSLVGFGDPGTDGARTVVRSVWVFGTYAWVAVAAVLAGVLLLVWAALSTRRRRLSHGR